MECNAQIEACQNHLESIHHNLDRLDQAVTVTLQDVSPLSGSSMHYAHQDTTAGTIVPFFIVIS